MNNSENKDRRFKGENRWHGKYKFVNKIILFLFRLGSTTNSMVSMNL